MTLAPNFLDPANFQKFAIGRDVSGDPVAIPVGKRLLKRHNVFANSQPNRPVMASAGPISQVSHGRGVLTRDIDGNVALQALHYHIEHYQLFIGWYISAFWAEPSDPIATAQALADWNQDIAIMEHQFNVLGWPKSFEVFVVWRASEVTTHTVTPEDVNNVLPFPSWMTVTVFSASAHSGNEVAMDAAFKASYNALVTEHGSVRNLYLGCYDNYFNGSGVSSLDPMNLYASWIQEQGTDTTIDYNWYDEDDYYHHDFLYEYWLGDCAWSTPWLAHNGLVKGDDIP